MISIRRIRSGEAALYRTVRLAALEDSPTAFCSTYADALARSEESWREQSDATAEGPDRATFLAFKGEAPVGMAALYRDVDRRGVGELLQVWVAPAHRGDGTAAALMNGALDWARENGFESVIAQIRNGNARASNFYRNYGFSEPLIDFTAEPGCVVLWYPLQPKAMPSSDND